MKSAGPEDWQEHALLFPIAGEQGVGVVTVPAMRPAQTVGMVLLAGGPQYRAGAHRHYVHLARELAAAGFASLRFDARGKGDSSGEFNGFENQDQDIASAIDALMAAHPAVRCVALFGLCDGASAAALYVERMNDPRVVQLVLLNPWVRHEQSQARAQLKHRYFGRLMQLATWRRFVRGRVGWRVWTGLFAALRTAASGGAGDGLATTDYRAGVFNGLTKRPAALLLSAADATAQEFHAFLQSLPKQRQQSLSRGTDCIWIQHADHTLTTREAQAECLRHTIQSLAARNIL
jgi:exosortase A-associated hydrolase 1